MNNFVPSNILKLIRSYFNPTTGHNHDGINSKLIEGATVADGGISTAKLAAKAVTTAKIGDGAVAVSQLGDAAVETIKIKDANVTPAKLSPAAAKRILVCQVEDLAAGVDIANRVIFAVPAGINAALISAAIIPQGPPAGVDDSNKCDILLSDGTNSIVSVEYDASPVFPAAGVVSDLGALDGTYKVLSAGEKLCLSVTNGATANLPAFLLEVVYTVTDAA
jgi:hypothetical protein